MTTQTSASLAQRWAELLDKEPQLRIRNAADRLGVSEVELLATQCGGKGVIRLEPKFREILREVEGLGKVMALTRNEYAVHERKGVYLNPHLSDSPVGMFVGEDIDLRIFFQYWESAYAVEQSSPKGSRYSLQFFAQDGTATHKIFLLPSSKFDVFEEIVEKYKHENQGQEQVVIPIPPKDAPKPIEEVDIEAFQEGWRSLKDTHHFFGLIRKHGLQRLQALELAPEGNYAVKVNPKAFRACMEGAAQRNIPIMVFVSNGHNIQIHSGPVKRLVDAGGWFNVLDPDFNLHLKEEGIAQAWVVRKPTEDGAVTALECYNSEGQQIVQLFGKRKPGIPELEDWREIVANVEERYR